MILSSRHLDQQPIWSFGDQKQPAATLTVSDIEDQILTMQLWLSSIHQPIRMWCEINKFTENFTTLTNMMMAKKIAERVLPVNGDLLVFSVLKVAFWSQMRSRGKAWQTEEEKRWKGYEAKEEKMDRWLKFYRVAERSGEGRDEVWRDGPRRRQRHKCVLGALFF